MSEEDLKAQLARLKEENERLVVGVEDHGERVAGRWIDVDLRTPEPNGWFAVDKGAAHPDPPDPTGAGHGPPESPLENGALVSGDAVIEAV